MSISVLPLRRFSMGIRAALGITVILAASLAQGSSLDDYLKQRRTYGITQATTPVALETLLGEGTMEIRATVKGTFGIGSTVSLLIEVPGAEPVVVRGSSIPQWLQTPHALARMIVKARRPNEFAQLEAQLIAAIEEGIIARWEAEERARAARAAQQQRSNTRQPVPEVSRGATNARDWNLEPNAAVPLYAEFIRNYNRRLTPQKATEIAEGIIGFSVQYGVDARLITAMVLVESGFNPSATSNKGAMGLGQLMPGTARGMGVRNAYDTFENLWGTVRLIRGHMDNYSKQSGDTYKGLVLALAAYNAGSGAVRRHGGVPPYRETQGYIQKVIDWYKVLSGAK